eukprot:g2160.t1
MKGVSNGAIQWRCKELDETPLELYSRLYEKGKGEEFDLLKDADGFAKPNFKFHNNYKISNNLEFLCNIFKGKTASQGKKWVDRSLCPTIEIMKI